MYKRAVVTRAFGVHILRSSHSQGDWILRRLDLLRVRDPTLFPDLIRRLHDNNTLLPSHSRTFQLPLRKSKVDVSVSPRAQMPCPQNMSPDQTVARKGGKSFTHIPNTSTTLVRLPKHALSRNLAFHLPHLLITPRLDNLRIQIILRGNEPIVRGSERRPIDLNLSLRSLDPNSRFGRIESIRQCRDAEVCKGDAVSGMFAAGGRGEGKQDGGFFVGAGAVLFDRCEDGGGFAVGGGDGVVEGLEAPR